MPMKWIVEVLFVPMLLAFPTVRSQQPPESQVDGSVVVNSLMWAIDSNGENIDWNSATEYCRDLRLGGHANWRLPTIEELEALSNQTRSEGAGPALPLTSCCFWSSTVLEDDGDQRRALDVASYAWGFYFPGPDRYYSSKGFDDGQALCVRPSL